MALRSFLGAVAEECAVKLTTKKCPLSANNCEARNHHPA